MKHCLLLLATFLSVQFSFSQNWHFVGGSTGYDASEVDIEISVNGVLYMAYVDPNQSGKVTVRRRENNSWQLVGAAGIGLAGATELQLVTTADNKPAFAAKCMRNAGSNYESFEIYEWSGTAWVDRNVFGYAITDHSKGISLCSNNAGQLLFTFFSSDEQSNNYPEGAITVNINTQLQIGDLIVDENNDEYLDQISTVATTATGVRHAFSYNDVGSGGSAYSYLSGGIWNRITLSSDEATKIKIVRGAGSTNYSTMWTTTNSGNKLNYRSFTATAGNPLIVIPSSSTAPEFDFDTYNDDAYVFYRSGTTCYFKKITGSVSPTSTVISSGTTLAPANAFSLAAERYYGINVIAYISGTKCLVKESNEASDIDDYGPLTMCEGAPLTSNFLLYFVDSNYDITNNSLLVTSTNTALVTNSAITTFSNTPGYFGINISGTNDVATPTTMDIKCVLVEDGVHVDSVLIPLTINPKPNIVFDFPTTTICENASPVNLNNLVSPVGGTWTGTGVTGNYFNPSYNPISTPANLTLNYSRTNNFGCSASQGIGVTVVPSPLLAVNVINANCNANNGAASVSITEGMAPYTIHWSNGSTQSLITQLSSGAYYLQVSDVNNCAVNQAVMIGTNGVALTAQQTDIVCYGQSNGAIDVTVTGGSGTLSYAWSNGATTQDLTGIPAGAYEIVITDEEGCVATASYTLTQPQQLIAGDTETNLASCGNDDGAAYITIDGGTEPLTYTWFDTDGNELGNTGDALEDVVAGNYSSQVVDANGCGLFTDVLISNAGGPLLAIDTVITSSCSGDGEIQLINVTNNVIDYSWNNGETSEDLTGLEPGTYILNAEDTNGCITVLSATVGSTAPQNVDICMVTVDTSTNTNLIIWEKPVTNAIDHFNIYRETSQSGIYQLAGSVAYTEESLYNDLVASPSVRSWRYKISAVDDCGTESELSAHHKTIHLTMNLGLGTNINLFWDSYEGFAFPEFVIKRHTNLDDWITLQTMPTTLFSYTDTPPTTEGLMYMVTIVPPAMCSTTKSAQDFNSSRSNKDNRFSTNIDDTGLQEILAGSMKLFPNPSNGTVSFENNAGVVVNAVVVDPTGRTISSFTLSQGITQKDLGNLSDGMYHVIYEYETIRFMQKMTVQH